MGLAVSINTIITIVIAERIGLAYIFDAAVAVCLNLCKMSFHIQPLQGLFGIAN